MTPGSPDILAAARMLADDVLFPDAMRVDAGRCGRMLGPGPLDDELAVRSAAALAVRDGSKSIMADQQPPRLAREALFLLVFGSRPPIKTALW
jgi:hypothetical protein